MIPATTLLVPVERPPHAATALPVARELARLKGATVSLIHVGVEPLEPGELLDHIGLSPEDARGLVIDQRAGFAADVVAREAAARHAELIVMCTPARPDRVLHPFGSVAGDVLRTAPCPVVLVPRERGQGSWALHQLVLPHDGTPTSAAAIAARATVICGVGSSPLTSSACTTACRATASA